MALFSNEDMQMNSAGENLVPPLFSESSNMQIRTHFYFGFQMQLLFADWITHSPGSYALSMAAVFIMALFYEWFDELKHRTLKLIDRSNSGDSGKGTGGLVGLLLRHRRILVLLITFLHTLKAACGYLLMLVVMTFNAGLFLTVLAGLSIGFIFFHFQQTA